MPFFAEGCWFHSVPNEDSVIVLCAQCHESWFVGSYWDFNNGCGPWDIVCSKCAKLLHKYVSPQEQAVQEIDTIFDDFSKDL